MTYAELMERVALCHAADIEEVEKEIGKAVEAAGLDIPVQDFIALCAIRAQKEINQNRL